MTRQTERGSRLLQLFPEVTEMGIDFVDVGCSGGLSEKWNPLAKHLNYVGFEPDAGECERLRRSPSRYRTARFFPNAVNSTAGRAALTTTSSLYCYSLLKPRTPWLNRFTFGDLFTVTGQAEVDCVTLDGLAETDGLKADVLKLDTQGLELPILRSGQRVYEAAFCIETETGYVQNYVGETVAAEIDTFMRERGYMLFDIVVHRMGRKNSGSTLSRQQPMWCECVWLKDYLAEASWGINVPAPTRLQGLKALCVCEALGFADYGIELCGVFRSQGLLTEGEFAAVSNEATWKQTPRPKAILESVVEWIPGRLRAPLYEALRASRERPHPLKKLLGK